MACLSISMLHQIRIRVIMKIYPGDLCIDRFAGTSRLTGICSSDQQQHHSFNSKSIFHVQLGTSGKGRVKSSLHRIPGWHLPCLSPSALTRQSLSISYLNSTSRKQRCQATQGRTPHFLPARNFWADYLTDHLRSPESLHNSTLLLAYSEHQAESSASIAYRCRRWVSYKHGISIDRQRHSDLLPAYIIWHPARRLCACSKLL